MLQYARCNRFIFNELLKYFDETSKEIATMERLPFKRKQIPVSKSLLIDEADTSEEKPLARKDPGYRAVRTSIREAEKAVSQIQDAEVNPLKTAERMERAARMHPEFFWSKIMLDGAQIIRKLAHLS
jgi:hypothetical protein